MKNLKLFLLTLLALCLVCSAAGAEQASPWAYDAGNLCLKRVGEVSGDVVIPAFKGRLIFGIGCGLITCVIRLFGSLPEGVSFSIILMNILVPHIEHMTTSRPFGEVKEKKKKEAVKA